MTKCFKKCLSLLLAIVLCMGTTNTAFAAEERDPYTIEGHYVEELVQLNEEELANLPLEQAETLFEEAFAVPADNYTEDEIRLGLDGLSFGLKFQLIMDEIKKTADTEPSYPAKTRSTTSSVSYSGDIGVAWVRDTTSGHSPLTLG